MIHSDIFYKICMSHPSIMLICDSKTGNIIDANESASKAYGYSIDELKKLNAKDICNYSKTGIKAETKVISNNARKVFRAIHKNKSGALMDMIVNSVEVKIDDDNILLMHTIFPFDKSKGISEEDISFAENTNEPFIAIDHLCNVVLANKLFEEIFGKIDKNLIGKNISKLLEHINCYQSDDFYNSVKQGLISTNSI
ncbi:MAG: PAS domain S-box protein, partial [Spirochaetaceae bacterium]|nr:PAS domain S-box protein [Spirochaetaceae bacterium]